MIILRAGSLVQTPLHPSDDVTLIYTLQSDSKTELYVY